MADPKSRRFEDLDSLPPSSVPASRVRRVPLGYRGLGHETIGSDIQSLVDAVLMPEQIFGKELCDRPRSLKSTDWYPIGDLLDALEHVDRRLGADSMRKIGWSLFKLSHEAEVRAKCTSARDIVYGIDAMYHRANRGEAIGGWTVLDFSPGRALLEKTTPHHCVVEEGILEAGLRTVGVFATLHQETCFRRNDPTCRIVITSHVSDARWSGPQP